MRFGDLLRRHRVAAGMTLEQLGSSLSSPVSHATISTWETCRAVPNRARISQLVVALGLSEPEWAALEKAAQIDELRGSAA
jgi:transcriptional regulator with XRE-family HTH domain